MSRPMMTSYRRTAHLSAIITLIGVFPLLLVGAGVTSKDAGMAFPDWPTSDGSFLNPPGWTQREDTLWEHGHRLIGWVVGMSSVVLAIVSVRRDLGASRWLGLAAPFVIGVQGVLGGLRVTEDSRALAMVHGIWGQVCFCLIAMVALMTSKAWLQLGGSIPLRSGAAVPRLCLITTAVLFVQLALGAGQRHFSGGQVLVAHVLWAILVVFLTGWTVLWILGLSDMPRIMSTLAQIAGLLVMLQLVLGALSWLTGLPGAGWPRWMVWVVPSAHVGVGALVLADFVLLTGLAHRTLRPAAARTAELSAAMSPA